MVFAGMIWPVPNDWDSFARLKRFQLPSHLLVERDPPECIVVTAFLHVTTRTLFELITEISRIEMDKGITTGNQEMGDLAGIQLDFTTTPIGDSSTHLSFLYVNLSRVNTWIRNILVFKKAFIIEETVCPRCVLFRAIWCQNEQSRLSLILKIHKCKCVGFIFKVPVSTQGAKNRRPPVVYGLNFILNGKNRPINT